MTHINNHRLDFAIDKPSPNHSGIIDPRFLVMHYTAGWTAQSAVATFQNPASKVSAHVTIDQNGVVYQHVPFNVKAWHAGPSTYAGYNGLNSYSIGIELVNPGYLVKVGNEYRDAFGRMHSASEVGPVIEAKHARVGSGTYYWPLYTESQLSAAEELAEELIMVYNLIDVVSHEEIDTRGWKTDPGSAFPMKRFKKLFAGERAADTISYQVTASSLNVRNGPGTEFSVKGSVKKGDIVEVQAVDGRWGRINDDGWVHMGYLRQI